MRLDCDEAVAASRPLWNLYQESGVPLSLAILTGQETGTADEKLLEDVLVGGGSVVSHSMHHYPNWGGSYHVALQEAEGSREWLETHAAAAAPVEYAVSPFHQNPPYAVQALADCGYQGFVGGIIANDPEFLIGRAGRVPFAQAQIVSHSAQCMLHGDCYLLRQPHRHLPAEPISGGRSGVQLSRSSFSPGINTLNDEAERLRHRQLPRSAKSRTCGGPTLHDVSVPVARTRVSASTKGD
jgi:hypothetical protein